MPAIEKKRELIPFHQTTTQIHTHRVTAHTLRSKLPSRYIVSPPNPFTEKLDQVFLARKRIRVILEL